MSTIEIVKLGELYEVHNGLSKSGKFFGTGFPFLTFSTVFNNYFIPDELTELVQSTKQEQESYSIRRGDVFVTRTSETSNELGMSCVALKDYPHATYNGFTKRMRPISQRVLPEYIGYYMRMPNFRNEFLAFSTMTTRASLRNEDLLGLSIRLPSIEEQTRIAGILSAYNELIETNQRQIKLLEEAAQRLYKEWFVDLRYPGHENVPVVDGVPEGWKKTTIGEMCVKTKDTVAAENIPAGTPYIGLEHIPRHDFCLSEWGDSAEVSSSKAKFKCNDIIFGQIRPYFHKVGFAITDGVASTDSFIMTPKNGVWALFLLTVFSDAFVNYSYQTCKEGAKMPRADWNQMKQYYVMIADSQTQAKFENKIWGITEKVRALSLQNRKLSEARDRLLPKLMSGEIAV